MRARLLAVVLLMATPVLAGCGFTPLYAQPGVTPGLAAIETVAPEGRAGYLLREALDDALARDARVPASYRLQIELKQTRTPRGRRVDSAASRYEMVLLADWKLLDARSGDVAFQGQTSTEVTFDRADQPYASIAGHQDAEQRAANELARKIQLQLADWMARGRTS
jgi:LPS-assembly lipoprotein